MDNCDLSSTRHFYNNDNNNYKTLIATPWYNSSFNQFSNAMEKIKNKDMVYIINNLWYDCCNNYLPNKQFKSYSFKMIYYDGTCTYFGTKRKKCINREIKPYNDIEIVFKKQLFIKKSVSYFALTVSIRGYKNGEKLFTEKITNDIIDIANKYGYKINDCKYIHNFKSRKMLLLIYYVYYQNKVFYGNYIIYSSIVILLAWLLLIK